MMHALADAYESCLTLSDTIREASASRAACDTPEIILQSRWFNAHCGLTFTSICGRKFQVKNTGRWNRDAGPDFRDAVLIFDDGREERGDIEIDRTDSDWESHGHSRNPAFNNVILHVFILRSKKTFFTRSDANREILQLHLPALADELPTTTPRTTHALTPLDALSQPVFLRLLEAAAAWRLRRKARRLHSLASMRGQDQILFEHISRALGYSRNANPMMLCAQRAGLTAARADNGEALLFGLAGFLEDEPPSASQKEAVLYHRALWQQWWKIRAGYDRLLLSRKDWDTASLRPFNHPHRRLGTVSAIASAWPSIRRAFQNTTADALEEILSKLSHPFWNRHHRLGGAPLKNATALLGAERIKDILTNVWWPWVLQDKPDLWKEFRNLKHPTLNNPTRDALAAIPNAAQSLNPRHVWVQQGLLQLLDDGRTEEDTLRLVKNAEKENLFTKPA